MSTVSLPTISDRVTKIIAEQFAVNGDAPVETKPDAHLYHDLGFDSLDIVEITMGIEDDFGFEIDDTVMSSFSTVQSLVDCATASGKV